MFDSIIMLTGVIVILMLVLAAINYCLSKNNNDGNNRALKKIVKEELINGINRENKSEKNIFLKRSKKEKPPINYDLNKKNEKDNDVRTKRNKVLDVKSLIQKKEKERSNKKSRNINHGYDDDSDRLHFKYDDYKEKQIKYDSTEIKLNDKENKLGNMVDDKENENCLFNSKYVENTRKTTKENNDEEKEDCRTKKRKVLTFNFETTKLNITKKNKLKRKVVLKWPNKFNLSVDKGTGLLSFLSLIYLIEKINSELSSMSPLDEYKWEKPKVPEDRCCTWWNTREDLKYMRPGSKFDASHYWCYNCHFLVVSEEPLCFRCKKNWKLQQCPCKIKRPIAKQIYRDSQVRVIDKPYMGARRIEDLTTGLSRI